MVRRVALEMKYVLVTGAGSGLGYELTRLHAEQGWFVFALYRSVSDRLTELAKAHPDNILPLPCDVASTDAVNAAMDAVKARTDRLDRIFNNAGIHRFKDWCTLEEAELDFCKVMFDINAVGPLRIVKAAIPLLREGSCIINISSEAASIEGTKGVTNYAYSMSKAGMNMGARIMDNWLIGRGIRTLMIHPGRMRTAMKGAHSDVDPWDVAAQLMSLVDRIHLIPEDQKFMDYQGKPYKW